MSTEYFGGVDQSRTVKGMRDLARKCDELLRSMGGLRPALRSLQEGERRNLTDQWAFALWHQHLLPMQFPTMGAMLSHGVSAFYAGGIPSTPRRRGLPYQQNNEENSGPPYSRITVERHLYQPYVRARQ